MAHLPPHLSRTFQDELRRLDPLLSCSWNDGLCQWEISRLPRIVKFRGSLFGGSLYVVEPEPFHILTVKSTNLATMDWRVINRLNEIDLWTRYEGNLKQYDRDLEDRVKEHREGKVKKLNDEMLHVALQNKDGLRGMRENIRLRRSPFWTPEVQRTRKHFSYAGQGTHGYRCDTVKARR